MQSSDVVAGNTGNASDLNNVREDLIRHGGDYATSGGAANVQTLSIDAAYDSYTTGDVVKFKAGYTNTAAATLNINTLGAKSLKKYSSTQKIDVEANDIVAGQLYYVWYDGTDLIVINGSRNRVFELVTAGETIAVNSIVYYDTTDNEWEKADADDTSKVRAAGIAVTAGTDGNPMLIQTSGIFTATSGTPFTAEAMHYLSSTAGGVVTTPNSTTVVPVGYAMTTTEMVLTWGQKMAAGSGTGQSSTTSETITPGFRVEHLILMGKSYADASNMESGALHYIGGQVVGGFAYYGLQSVDSGSIATDIRADGSGNTAILTAGSFTDTGFNIVSTITNSGTTSSIKWIAFGN